MECYDHQVAETVYPEFDPRTRTLFGRSKEIDTNLYLTPRYFVLDDAHGLTFQVIEKLKVEEAQEEASRQSHAQQLWRAISGRNLAISKTDYSQFHRYFAHFCNATNSDSENDWVYDSCGANEIDIQCFYELLHQFQSFWAPIFQASKSDLLEILVTEMVDADGTGLVVLENVHEYKLAALLRDTLDSATHKGTWEWTQKLAMAIGIPQNQNLSMFQTTEAVVKFLDAVASKDRRWMTKRISTLAWLSKHQSDKDFSELQSTLRRLHVEYDVAPLMRQRLDSLVQQIRNVVIQSLIKMEHSSLLKVLEWLRTMTIDMWRTLSCPLGHLRFQAYEQVQQYFQLFSQFPLQSQLCRFCNDHGIIEKQELLLFFHSLTPLQLSHFRETLQRPTRGFLTSLGVKLAVEFHIYLSASERLILKKELSDMLKLNKEVETTLESPLQKRCSSREVYTASKSSRQRKKPPPRSPLSPITKTTGGVHTESMEAIRKDQSFDLYSLSKTPSTKWFSSQKECTSPERLQYESAYFDAPTICRVELEFPSPQHVKHFSLPSVKGKTPNVSTLSLDKTWNPPVDLGFLYERKKTLATKGGQ